MTRLLLPVALATLTLTGTLEAQDSLPARRAQYHRDRITRDEVQERASDAKTAYDIVSRLRSQYLRPRPSGSIRNRAPVPVRVYVDGVHRGGVDTLRDILAHNVALIEWMNGSDATTRWGTGHESGAILVRTGG